MCHKAKHYIFIIICVFYYSNAFSIQYWEGPAGYYESLSSACDALASQSGGEVCDISGPEPWGTLQQGSCQIGDCDNFPRWHPHYTKELYTVMPSLDNNQPNICTGNPIDPVTGNKLQRENIVHIDAVYPIIFDLYYNSNRIEKWRHTYSRTLSFSSTPNGPRYDFTGVALGLDPIAEAESPSFMGGEAKGYGVKYTAPQYSEQYSVFATEEQACETGWINQRQNYHYSWAATSVAEYRLKPISSLGGIWQCYILDKPNGKIMLVHDVYDVIGGHPAGGYGEISAFSLPGGQYLRFTRKNGSVVTFSPEFLGMENLSHTGEVLEKIDTNGVITYRLHNSDDEVEEYSSSGKLLSITSSGGHVQTLIYDPALGLLKQVVNETGESITFVYEEFGDSNQYSRIRKLSDSNNREWIFNYNESEYTLASIDMPDGTSRQYHYEDSSDLQLLTGITDETGQRYSTWEYDNESRATLSAHGVSQDVDRVELSYSTNGFRTVTKKRVSTQPGSQPLDIVSNYISHTSGNSPIVAEVTGNAPVKFEHDAETGNLEYKIEDILFR